MGKRLTLGVLSRTLTSPFAPIGEVARVRSGAILRRSVFMSLAYNGFEEVLAPKITRRRQSRLDPPKKIIRCQGV